MSKDPGRPTSALLLFSVLLFIEAGAAALGAAPPRLGQAAVGGGGIVGQVELPGDVSSESVVQALLLPPEWAMEWNSDVQERLRVHFSNNARAVEADASLFDRIAYRARREATAFVSAQMQGNLGVESFERLVTGIEDGGTFEFTELGSGEYQVVVVAQGGGVSYVWAQPVRVSGALPQFVDMGPYFR
jgi:hypothetical protein